MRSLPLSGELSIVILDKEKKIVIVRWWKIHFASLHKINSQTFLLSSIVRSKAYAFSKGLKNDITLLFNLERLICNKTAFIYYKIKNNS